MDICEPAIQGDSEEQVFAHLNRYVLRHHLKETAISIFFLLLDFNIALNFFVECKYQSLHRAIREVIGRESL